jgi:hypothetical protein
VVKIGRFIAAMEDMLRRSLGEEIELETVIRPACGIPSSTPRRWKMPSSTCASMRATRWTASAS